MNAEQYTNKATDRLTVEIVPATLSLSINKEEDESVLYVQNTGKKEINLGGWTIRSGKNTFIFSPDTIILAEKTLMFGDMLIAPVSLSGGDVQLVSPKGRSVSIAKGNLATRPMVTKKEIPSVTTSTSSELTLLQEKINALKAIAQGLGKTKENQKLASTIPRFVATKNTVTVGKKVSPVTPTVARVKSIKTQKVESNLASIALAATTSSVVILPEPKSVKSGFLSRLFGW
jgi:hypothetical protein